MEGLYIMLGIAILTGVSFLIAFKIQERKKHHMDIKGKNKGVV
jgi:hypothetical protein